MGVLPPQRAACAKTLWQAGESSGAESSSPPSGVERVEFPTKPHGTGRKLCIILSVTDCHPSLSHSVLQMSSRDKATDFLNRHFFKDSICNLTKPVAFWHPMAHLQSGGALQTPTGAVSTSRSWKEASSHHLPLHLTELRTCQSCPFRAPCPLSRHASGADSCLQWALRC